jgi:hypothetical protein
MKLPITDIPLAEYQTEAIGWWREHGHRGAVAFPIGLAGTITGIKAIAEIDHPASVTLVICPTARSLETFTTNFVEGEETDVHSIAPTSDSDTPVISALADAQADAHTVVLLTAATFRQTVDPAAVREAIDRPLQIFLPELDSLATEILWQLDDLDFERILGLSIVPEDRLERVYSVDSRRLDAYQAVFEDNIYSYTLERAIADRFLRPFRYYPIVIRGDLENTEEVDEESLPDLDEEELKAFKQYLSPPEQTAERMQVLENLLGSDLRPPVVFFCKRVATVESVCDLLDKHDGRYLSVTAADEDIDQKINEFVDGDYEYLVASMAAVQFYELGDVETAVLLSSSNQPISEYQSLNQVFMGTEWRNATLEAVDIYDIVPVPRQRVRASDGDTEQFLRRSTGVMKILIDASKNQHRTEYRLYRQLEEFEFGHLVYE